jgi:hypothetical protein
VGHARNGLAHFGPLEQNFFFFSHKKTPPSYREGFGVETKLGMISIMLPFLDLTGSN